MDRLDDIPTGPLNAVERRSIRMLLRDKERRDWLRRQAGIWLRWVTISPAMGAGIYFIWNWLTPFVMMVPHK